jgi:hypothetical protein
MEAYGGYFDRKREELALIASGLRRRTWPEPRTIEAVIEAKFRLGAELKAKQVLDAWEMTETNWQEVPSLQSGPFKFSYRYQRADLAVAGPFPYGSNGLGGATVHGPIYTCSGMAVISALLLALGAGNGAALMFPPGAYKETLEFAASYAGVQVVHPSSLPRKHPEQAGTAVLWFDAPPFGAKAQELDPRFRDADLVVFDTTAFAAGSGRMGRFLRWARRARVPAVLVRSHTKLDTLGIEYGRLGSATFVSFPEVPLRKLMRCRHLVREMREAVRLLGSAALPAHFCPFVGSPRYRELSSRRTAAMLRNGRFLTNGLVAAFGAPSIRRYSHGLFVGLVPRGVWTDADATAEAGRMAASLARSGMPVRHAGGFGFDFVAIDGFFDTGADRNVLRLAFADFPLELCARLTEGITSLWADHWRIRAA